MTEIQNQKPDRIAAKSPLLIILCLVFITLLLAGDWGLKYWSFANLGPEPVDVLKAAQFKEPLPRDNKVIIPSVLRLELVLNHGAVFGSFSGQRWLFVAITIVAMLIVAGVFLRSQANAWILHFALVLIVAGAIGNFYDRLFYGAVRDMLHMFPGIELPFGWSWPGGIRQLYPWVFNLADVYLVVGIGVIMLRMLFTKDPEKQSQEDGKKQAAK